MTSFFQKLSTLLVLLLAQTGESFELPESLRSITSSVLQIMVGMSTEGPAVSGVSSKNPLTMPALDTSGVKIPRDEGGLKEYSVVYTDRALNHMSATFQQVMKDLFAILTDAYNAKSAVIIPGSGTFAMESVARQLIPNFKNNEKVLVLRNGYFSYRWTDILTQTRLSPEHIVIKAKPVDVSDKERPSYAPPPLKEVLAEINRVKPGVMFAPHIETSTGIILNDDYIIEIVKAVQSHGGYFVLDGIAAGLRWADMKKLGIDFYISAPQKAWTGPAGAGLIMLSERGYQKVTDTTSDSMAMNLKKWRDVMESYLNPGPGHSYYTTMPTDVLEQFRNTAMETKNIGWTEVQAQFDKQGQRVYELLEKKFGLKIVAAPENRAPGVVVAYVPNCIQKRKLPMAGQFKAQGMQIAAGVPFQLGEGEIAQTFRLGLFGLDKLYNADQTIKNLEVAITDMMKGNHPQKSDL